MSNDDCNVRSGEFPEWSEILAYRNEAGQNPVILYIDHYAGGRVLYGVERQQSYREITPETEREESMDFETYAEAALFFEAPLFPTLGEWFAEYEAAETRPNPRKYCEYGRTEGFEEGLDFPELCGNPACAECRGLETKLNRAASKRLEFGQGRKKARAGRKGAGQMKTTYKPKYTIAVAEDVLTAVGTRGRDAGTPISVLLPPLDERGGASAIDFIVSDWVDRVIREDRERAQGARDYARLLRSAGLTAKRRGF
ncbi:MAG: DUF1444 domain-containing protein [Clostridiales bacterium]|jgi:hypothetical protein|nr:DUF1444 domain-containing protein [Clostridiales bacterium]